MGWFPAKGPPISEENCSPEPLSGPPGRGVPSTTNKNEPENRPRLSQGSQKPPRADAQSGLISAHPGTRAVNRFYLEVPTMRIRGWPPNKKRGPKSKHPACPSRPDLADRTPVRPNKTEWHLSLWKNDHLSFSFCCFRLVVGSSWP